MLEEIRRYHRAEPWRPFVVRTASRSFVVDRAERLAIGVDLGLLIVMVGGPEGWALVPIGDVVAVEPS